MNFSFSRVSLQNMFSETAFWITDPLPFVFLNYNSCRRKLLRVVLWEESFWPPLCALYSNEEYTTIIDLVLKIMPWLGKKRKQKLQSILNYILFKQNFLSSEDRKIWICGILMNFYKCIYISHWHFTELEWVKISCFNVYNYNCKRQL